MGPTAKSLESGHEGAVEDPHPVANQEAQVMYWNHSFERGFHHVDHVFFHQLDDLTDGELRAGRISRIVVKHDGQVGPSSNLPVVTHHPVLGGPLVVWKNNNQ